MIVMANVVRMRWPESGNEYIDIGVGFSLNSPELKLSGIADTDPRKSFGWAVDGLCEVLCECEKAETLKIGDTVILCAVGSDMWSNDELWWLARVDTVDGNGNPTTITPLYETVPSLDKIDMSQVKDLRTRKQLE